MYRTDSSDSYRTSLLPRNEGKQLSMRVVFLTNNKSGRDSLKSRADLESFSSELEKALGDNYEITVEVARNLQFSVFDNRVSVSSEKLGDLRYVDLVVFRNASHYISIATALSVYLTFHNVRMVNNPKHNIAFDKLTQMVAYSLNNVPVPDSYFRGDVAMLLEDIKRISWKSENYVIVKDINGIKGNNNYLLDLRLTAYSENIQNSSLMYIAQEYIKNDGDYRVLFLDSMTNPVVFKRISSSSSHLNNISAGASADTIPLKNVPVSVMTTAKAAAEVANVKLAGVDVVLDELGKPYVFEVNETPSIASTTARGEKLTLLANYIHKNITASPRVKFYCLVGDLDSAHRIGSFKLLKDAVIARGLDFEVIECDKYVCGSGVDDLKTEPGTIVYRMARASSARQLEFWFGCEKGIAMVRDGTAWNSAYTPWASAMLIEAAELPSIPSVYGVGLVQKDMLAHQIEQLGGFPVVLKKSGGSHGSGVSLVQNMAELIDRLNTIAPEDSTKYALRKFIANARHARIVVVDGVAVDSIEYIQPANDFRTNATETPNVVVTKFDSEVEAIAVAATEALGSLLGGVDILIDETGLPYIAEVNIPCNFSRNQNLTGIPIAALIVEALVKRSNRIKQNN